MVWLPAGGDEKLKPPRSSCLVLPLSRAHPLVLKKCLHLWGEAPAGPHAGIQAMPSPSWKPRGPSKQHAPGPGGGKGPRPRAAPASRRRRINPRPPVPRLPQLFNPSFFALISLLFSRISVSALQPPASLRRQGDETGDSGLMRSCVIRRRPWSSPHQRSEPTPLLSVKIPAELLLLPHLQSCHFL